MQDRLPPDLRNSCNARPDHTIGSEAVVQRADRMACESVLGCHRAKQAPFVGHAFEKVTAALFKRQAGACYQIANRL